MTLLSVENLTLQFDTDEGRITAVDDVSFRVERGEVFGFLGPNGAGKTTTIKVLLGILAPDGGAVRVAGLAVPRDIEAEVGEARRREAGRQGLDILREVIAPYGLTLQTELTSMPGDNRHQNKTDYRFIRELAEENGYEWYLRDRRGGVRELCFGPVRASAEAAGNKLMVHAGRETNCLAFSVSYDGYQPDRIRVSTAPLSGDEIAQASEVPELQPFGTRATDSSDSGLDDFEWCLPPRDGNNQEGAQARARGVAEERAFKLKASGRLDGTAYGGLLLPGTVVEVGADVTGFEVGDEVRQVFISGDPAASGAFVANARGRWQADLVALARQREGTARTLWNGAAAWLACAPRCSTPTSATGHPAPSS